MSSRSSRRGQEHWRRVAVLIGILLLVSACYEEFGPDAITILNESVQTVDIVAILGPADEHLVRTLDPGEGTRFRDVCLDRDLEARTTNGRVLDRRDGPFCQGDAEWVITDDR